MAKTLKQLEREYHAYIQATKSGRKKVPKLPKVPNLGYRIESRAVSIYDNRGKRVRNARWGKYVVWNRQKENAKNFREAVVSAMNRLRQHRTGTVIYIRAMVNGRATQRMIPLFQAKWGTDGLPFTTYNDAIGNWWARQAGLIKTGKKSGIKRRAS